MTSRRGIVIVLTALFSALFVTGCDGLVSDPNFHTWCGDQLCAWKLESGHIQRAPTWNEKDYGVELLDTPTVISQHIDATPKCLEFTTVADVAVEAQVSVGVDFDDDGTVDYEQAISAVGFTEQKTQITAPLAYSNFRLLITKKGAGRAVLAQLNIDDNADCSAAVPVKLTSQAIGSRCASNNHGLECKSGICCEGRCAECCGAGSNDTCATGTCGRLAIDGLGTDFEPSVPKQCAPGKLKRPKNAECLLDDDCASGNCKGEVWDIRDDAINGPPCPPPPTQGKECNVYSVRGGVCE